jgi:hypothetical protein
LTLRVPVSDFPPGDSGSDAAVFQDGALLPPCSGAPRGAACVVSVTSDGSQVTIVVLTPHLSVWAVATPLVSRYAGSDRVATAVAVSRATFGDGTASGVVLARSDNFADALAAGPLAAAAKAPVLITGGSVLDPRVMAEIARVLPSGGGVTIVGGEAAVPASVADSITAAGFAVTRVWGTDRYGTAVAVANAMPAAPAAVVLASGQDFADGLVAAPAAGHVHGVVLLTAGSALPAPTRDYLAAHPALPVTAIGGPAAHAVPQATAIVGADRYSTAVLVAQLLYPATPPVVGMASGVNFPDGIAGGARLTALDAPLLLTAPTALPTATQAYLAQLQPPASRIEIYGGTATVGSEVEAGLAPLAG